MTIQGVKSALRKEFKRKRDEISSERKMAAENELFDAVDCLSKAHSLILSFESFGSEINTSGLNHFLEEEGKLVLPFVDQEFNMRLYKVSDRSCELKRSPLGFLQPDPLLCQEVDPKSLSLILVPGLSFDGSFHRLGYGKGCYDRLLENLPDIQAIGIGFREQYSIEKLPAAATDKPLSSILLF